MHFKKYMGDGWGAGWMWDKGTGNVLRVECGWWDECSLYTSFSLAAGMEIFVIECWGKLPPTVNHVNLKQALDQCGGPWGWRLREFCDWSLELFHLGRLPVGSGFLLARAWNYSTSTASPSGYAGSGDSTAQANFSPRSIFTDPPSLHYLHLTGSRTVLQHWFCT